MKNLKLEDFSWEDTNTRKYVLKEQPEKYCHLVYCYPAITSNEFKFTIKLHEIDNGGFQIGVCDKNNKKKDDNAYVFFGSSGIGWGWYHASRTVWTYPSKKYDDFTKETYSAGDEVSIKVSKKEKYVEFYKNDILCGRMENVTEFPKELVIATTVFYKVKFELIFFEQS